jgi:riboflavin kinase/FMN adenylyltransferase
LQFAQRSENMALYYSLQQIPPLSARPLVSVGNFDGLHVGHQALLRALLERARQLACPACALIFNPHPLTVLRPQLRLTLISAIEPRARLLQELGVEVVICLPFDHQLAALPPEEFVGQILVQGLRVQGVYEGYDFNFGKEGRGDITLLRKLGKLHDFTVKQVEPVIMDGAPVSSSRVRQAVRAGNLVLASRLLARPYRLWGRVIPGEGRGAQLLNLPTANLEAKELLLPPGGVYAARAGLSDDCQVYEAIFNLGLNPTFGELAQPRLEAHLFDFQGRLYGREIWLEPVAFLRPERKFSHLDLLKAQMAEDCAQARKLLAAKPLFPAG